MKSFGVNTLILLLVLGFQSAFALQTQVVSAQGAAVSAQDAYYGQDFFTQVLGHARDTQLKMALKTILKSAHIPTDGGYDKLAADCNSEKGCYTHRAYGYDNARKFLFGHYYLVKLDAANYGIQEMYCDRVFQGNDFKGGQAPGPGIVPDNNVINVEHTWPQSKFTGRYPKEMQKSDMHHLFPTDSKMNSIRGNGIFGEVTEDHGGALKCSASRSGTGSAGSTLVYEPPADHKGHVARALFYFAIRYDMMITPPEEAILRKWNHEHPVDAQEMDRNNAIAKIQGDRNPFVDHPEMVDQIADF